ncbi:MAG: LysR substrate-binding domain-containing protein [Rickettsiales bacterium]|jgi:DNA-binding transcriptional LysR family regulator|nr:LysR substrate-binding domain-containing protein [Rickettsiales bacterium]
MHTLSRIRVFVEVAKRKSFVAAGKALGITGPAASKQVMLLEDELGAKLLHRTTRVVTLTDEGAVYYERARVAIEELQDAADALRDVKSIPKGMLKISAPLSFGHQHLLPTFSGFAVKYPEIQMDVVLEDRAVDVVAEGFDIVIRIGVMKDSSLTMKPLAECPIVAVASPLYLKQHATIKAPNDLKVHRMIGYALAGSAVEWRYQHRKGKTGSVKTECVLRANTAEMMLQAALDGVGIAILPGFTVATYLKSGKLVRVLKDYESYPRRQIVALMPPDRHRSLKVKLFIEWLTSACKAIPMEIGDVA